MPNGGFQKDDSEIGQLWQSDDGRRLTGTINGVKVVAWKNDRATPENRQPLWRVHKDRPPEQRAPRRPPNVRPPLPDPDDPMPF